VNSARAKQPLVVFNSAAIPAKLAEAQLFGHAKGAFTGAVAAHEGYFA
jgi:transcriptional regulator with GAF, ATPase, and Fis domain